MVGRSAWGFAAGAKVGAAPARRGLLCFGAGEMLGYTSRPVGGVERLAGGGWFALRAGLGLAAVDYLRSYIWQSYSLIRLTAHGQDGARFTRNEKYIHAQNSGGERDHIPTLWSGFGPGFGAELWPEREEDRRGGGRIGGGAADSFGAGAAGRGSAGVRAHRDAGAGGAHFDCDEPDAHAAGAGGGRGDR